MTRKRCRVEVMPPILSDGMAVNRRRAVIGRLRRLGECDKSVAMAPIYSYARDLRTIGQQFDKQGIDIFALRYQDGDYFLEYADPNPPFTDLLHQRYSAIDLQSLELAAAQARSAGFTQVNFQSMAESLRATGRYVERLNGKLLRISTPDAGLGGILFNVEYQTRDGRHCFEDVLTNNLAELAIRMYKERARISTSRVQRPVP